MKKRILGFILCLAMLLPNCYIATEAQAGSTSTNEIPTAYRSDKVDTDGDGKADANYLPALRTQPNRGMSGPFSIISACETNLIKKGLVNNDIDLSESQLAYFMFNRSSIIGDQQGNLVGDGNQILSSSSSTWNTISNSFLTVWHLATWAGLTEESADSDFRQSVATSSLQMENTPHMMYGLDKAHLENCFVIGMSDADTVKKHIKEYGSVVSAYYLVTGTTASKYDSIAAGLDTGDEGSYYYYDGTGMNQIIQIVGWDDNYSADKFVSKPEGNGAWLVKNSIGAETSTGFAQNGYFWISYYDTALASQVAYAYDCELADNYDNIYQHDGATGDYRWKLTEAANVYEAADDEILEAVSVGMWSGCKYTVEIYVSDEELTASNLTSGEPVSTQSGNISYQGYHTIELDNPVSLKKGQKFVVVVRFASAASILFETGYTFSSWLECVTSKTAGQSYYGSNGSWIDASKDGNTFRIKAFTSSKEEVPVKSVDLSRDKVLMGKGEELTLTAAIYPENTTADKTIIWTSSDESVATVAEDGTVKALKSGTTVIRGKCGTKVGTCVVKVSSETISYSGKDGGLNWSITEDGLLTITGTGDYQNITWREYSDKIVKALVDVKDITKTRAMFQGCDFMEEVAFKNFDTSKVGDMGFMFADCTNLKYLDLSHFNTSNVTGMEHMFRSCESLEEIDLGNFDTSEVVSMSRMFAGCSSATEIIVENFNTSKVEDMTGMFESCSSVEELNVKGFDMSSVELMEFMFAYCDSLKEVNTENFRSLAVTSLSYMFFKSPRIETIDLRNMDLKKIENATRVIEGCTGLRNLYLPKKMNFSMTLPTVSGHTWFNDTSSCTDTSIGERNSVYYECVPDASLCVTGIELDQTELNVEKGFRLKLNSVVSATDEIPEGDLSWSSSDESVVAVDENGNIEALDYGTATITLKSRNRKSASCKVTVEEGAVIHLSQDGDLTWSLSGNGTLTITGTGDYETGEWKEYADDITKAIIDVDGISQSALESILEGCSSLKELYLPGNMEYAISLPVVPGYVWINGDDEICTQTAIGKEGETYYERITSSSQYITRIELDYTKLVLDKGEEISLNATIHSTEEVGENDIKWLSSDESVVKVSDGKIKAVGYGTATVTVMAQNRVNTSCEITVTATPETTIALSKNVMELKKGDADTLVATATGGYTNSKLAWESSDSNVVTISEDGVVQAVGIGKATITAWYAGSSASCMVTVTDTTPAPTPTPDGDLAPNVTPTPDENPTVDQNNNYLAVDTVVKIGNGKYRVLSSSASGCTVEYVKPVKAKASIKIPNKVVWKGIAYKVVRIGKNALKNKKKVKKVVIGKNVTYIGANAFKGCKKLKMITINSKKLKTVKKGAFKGINKKVKIKVPAKKYKKYKRMFKKKGLSAKAKIYKKR